MGTRASPLISTTPFTTYGRVGGGQVPAPCKLWAEIVSYDNHNLPVLVLGRGGSDCTNVLFVCCHFGTSIVHHPFAHPPNTMQKGG